MERNQRENTSPRKLASCYSGKWTNEEKAYVDLLMKDFKEGVLPLPEGKTLRSFIAEEIGCKPKRISKKFANTNYNGKLPFTKAASGTATPKEVQKKKERREELKRRFQESRLKLTFPEFTGTRSKDSDTPKLAAASVGQGSGNPLSERCLPSEGLAVDQLRGELRGLPSLLLSRPDLGSYFQEPSTLSTTTAISSSARVQALLTLQLHEKTRRLQHTQALLTATNVSAENQRPRVLERGLLSLLPPSPRLIPASSESAASFFRETNSRPFFFPPSSGRTVRDGMFAEWLLSQTWRPNNM